MRERLDTTRREARCKTANELLLIISAHGRRFFYDSGSVCRMHVDLRGRVWFRDAYSGRSIYTHYRGRWRGFTHGGTLKALVESLRDFITGRRKTLPLGHLGPWPETVCRGDLWGYGGAAMCRVRAAAYALSDREGLPREGTRL